ncbi:vWA-MoxR associated conflict system protein [Streptomyces griseoincarnatus]|uniref:vWA-MoxR associated conflict system protein n=1 Tax=unclassified Streptomyces TaxID=2593676 RepID=UPI000C8888B8|nr:MULTISPECIES: hypothetical protein [unclassified Streptomyces]MBJ6646097.1 hypothetical protein [Streptomyces sp. BSE7-9]MCA2203415.1 hypothetical protein [Streptomyces sp. SMS_SU21]NEA92672.1 hypothetical protein [Actinospica acidiphila]
MTAVPPPRHALVVAPQCEELGVLPGLEEVARDLRDTLTDDWRGACTPAVESGLLYGASVGRSDIDTAIRDAARRAGESGAMLVVALLGHGMTSGKNPRLFLMGGDSRRDETGTAVNVAEVLERVLETPGLPGLVALVDTCHAGGATPDLGALDAGVREGATQLSLLMAVGAAQEAHGLAFSRGVVRVLTQGLVGAGEFLFPDALFEAVRDEVPGQDARLVQFVGARFGERPWASRNAGHLARAGSRLGPIGLEELERTLVPLGGSALVPAPVSGVDVLDRLHVTLRERAAPGEALDVVDGLRDVLRTVHLLNSWPGGHLTSGRLRGALWRAAGRCAEPIPHTSGQALLRDAAEYLRFRAQRQGETPMARPAAFVAELAVEEGLGKDLPEFRAWRDAVNAKVEFDDAFAALTARDRRTRLRLVVSLHATLGDLWPEMLQAFLLDRGDVCAQADFPCHPSRSGVQQKLGEVLKWAWKKSRPLGPLRRVEVAAPAALLLEWRPEETSYGRRLGLMHDVVLRWSERMHPPDHMSWINEDARERLVDMSACKTGRAPVDWLEGKETGRPKELATRLERGDYTVAVGLRDRPQRMRQVMELLLRHVPIVLWPGAEGRMPDACADTLDRYWHLLPAEFSEAYRNSWSPDTRQGPDGHEHLALLRSIWHDTEWLDFCDWFEGFVTQEGIST